MDSADHSQLPIRTAHVRKDIVRKFTIEMERRVFVLFAYEYRPESTFFVVYNDNRDVEGDTERILFVKISHLFKLGMW